MQRKFLIIQALPEGMVAVIRHTVHGLLLAELTNRVPVILWMGRFLYSNNLMFPRENGFIKYFENNGLCDIRLLQESCKTFAPFGWNEVNIARDDLIEYRSDEHRPEYQPLPPCDIILCKADCVVYTHYQHIIDILPLIPIGHEYYGLQNSVVARMIYQKYFSLAESVSMALNHHRDLFHSGHRVLGIHCRGSDKVSEHPLATPRAYKKAITKLMSDTDRLFLATDSAQSAKQFRQWYASNLVMINCERSSGRRGIHFSAADRERAGRDFLVDAYLLSRCDLHFGNHGSHVSYFVQAMIRNHGEPYDNFHNVEASDAAHIARFLSYRFLVIIRQFVKRILFVGRK